MTDRLLTLVDSHAHLDNDQFKDDLEQVLKNADEAGVKQILTIGCDLKSSAKSVELASRFSCIHAAVGIHPHDARAALELVRP